MIKTLQRLPPIIVKAPPGFKVRDGKPMAETSFHATEMAATWSALDRLFLDRDDVTVAMNNFVYYDEANPKLCFSPDVYVVFGVRKALRDCFISWLEGGKLPTVIFEFTSASSRINDTVRKMDLYARLGVLEYLIVDPLGDYLNPRLKGFSLQSGIYVPMKPEQDGSLYSPIMDLRFFMDDAGSLRFYDRTTGRLVLRDREMNRKIDEDAIELASRERKRMAAVRKAARELESRLAAEMNTRVAEARVRLEADARFAAEANAKLEAKARYAAEAKAKLESEARAAAEAKVTLEADARSAAESEIARLKAELNRLKRDA